MREELITFETAKLAKDTGFDYTSWSYYYCSAWTGECDCVICNRK